MKKLVGLLVAALLAAPAAATAQVKIGVINSMTGPQAPIGESLTNGMKLAQEDLAKKGVKVDLVWEDDTGKPDKALSALDKLATRDNVVGVVGPYTSACANAVGQRMPDYELPLLVPAAAKSQITKPGNDWTFRLNAPDTYYASSLIDGALSLGKPKTMAILYENTDFGTSVGKAAKDIAAAKGLQVVFEEAYSQGSPDYRSTLTKVKGASPDLVFMVSYVADAILLMRQAREMGLKPQAFLGGGAGFDTAQFENEKEISAFVFSTTQWTVDVNAAASKDFAKRYQDKFGKKPTYHAACAYEAMMIMGQTAAKAGGDRKKTRDGLASGSWNGILGDVKFQAFDGYKNQNKLAMPVTQYLDGKSQTVFPEAYRTAKPVYPFAGWK